MPRHDVGTRRHEARRLRSMLGMLVRRFSLSERADIACCDMTVAQAATLEVLRSEGAMRLGALGQRLGITPSTLTRNLNRLQSRGFVDRRPDTTDARAAEVVLTDSGRRAAARIERREEEFARAVLDRLGSGDGPATLAMLENMLTAVRGATEKCCPGAFDHLMQDFPRDGSRTRRLRHAETARND